MSFTKEERCRLLIKEHFLLKNGYTMKTIAGMLGISLQTAYNYLNTLIKKGVIKKQGKRYESVGAEKEELYVNLKSTNEETVYANWLRDKIADISNNIHDICSYGFTEILNNAIDHSGSDEGHIILERDFSSIKIVIDDKGIGVFEKIKQERGLEMLHHAIIELDKGKVTTDAARHSGEGIFFTSKMFDMFAIIANGLIYRAKSQYDYQLLNETEVQTSGTCVFMDICLASDTTTKEVFDKYTAGDFVFSKTVVPVINLIDRRNESTMSLVSRSQAKRLLNGFDKFKVVILDFEGIESIGQGFADETFRVYPSEHPDVHISYKNATKEVEFMIKHVTK